MAITPSVRHRLWRILTLCIGTSITLGAAFPGLPTVTTPAPTSPEISAPAEPTPVESAYPDLDDDSAGVDGDADTGGDTGSSEPDAPVSGADPAPIVQPAPPSSDGATPVVDVAPAPAQPGESAPADPSPVAPAPAEPEPVAPAPVATAPAEPAPTESDPSPAAPADPTPAEPAAEPAPVQTSPSVTPTPASPPAGGAPERPTAKTTGVPEGTTLTKVYDDLVIRTPGTVIDSIELFGTIRVEAADVTISRSLLHGSSDEGSIAVYAGGPDVSNLVIEDVEISPTVKSYLTNGVYGHDFTLSRVNIHGVVDSVHIFNGGNVVVEDSLLHKNTHFGPSIDKRNADGSHDDNIQIQDGHNITIRNTVMSDAWNAAVQITQGRGPISDVTIEGNWIEGGGCALNIAEGKHGTISGLRIVDNVFGETRFNCPILITPHTKAVSTILDNALHSGPLAGVVCRLTTGNRAC
ncbi:hypothetical protein [Marisediminicola sp. LYQ85]|uniref:hypothetical protein n=1 Tax=Marisediminicola sp. LYQ85 TaxID=3391062 RepID=UPI003983AAE2